MNFQSALEALKAGSAVTRPGWNGKGLSVKVQVPDEHSKMKRPYLYMIPPEGTLVPWLPSQTDLFAEDWTIASYGAQSGAAPVTDLERDTATAKQSPEVTN